MKIDNPINVERDITFYNKIFSENEDNGVYALNRIGFQTKDCANPTPPREDGPVGPIGFRMKKYPYSGAPWEVGKPGSVVWTLVYGTSIGAITYQESDPKMEEAWLQEVPCASRTIVECLIKILNQCFDDSDKEIQAAALSIIEGSEGRLSQSTWQAILDAAVKGEKTVPKRADKEAIIAFLTGSQAIIPNF